MSLESQMEQEEQLLEEEYANGDISLEEYNKGMRELQRDYVAAVEEEAERAREDVYNRHYW